MKRLFDILFALVVLILSLPFMLIIVGVIKLTSSGPVIYSQKRVGKNGQLFTIHKFRTMESDADRKGTSVTTRDDPRITKIGRLLRRTKLDELPQFWTVLAGHMSIVGPRPDVPEIVETYSPDMKRILHIRPGITSIASVYLRNEEALLAATGDPDRLYIDVIVPAKVGLAMRHVDKQSFIYDTGILLRTLCVCVLPFISTKSERAFLSALKMELCRNQTVESSKETMSKTEGS
jgi:lipopolysaccharide/colanic/teichoic acid biosynthesis glycosyltransferase